MMTREELQDYRRTLVDGDNAHITGYRVRTIDTALALIDERDRLRDALKQITPWSQADQDDPEICAMQWRGCVAIARHALKEVTL